MRRMGLNEKSSPGKRFTHNTICINHYQGPFREPDEVRKQRYRSFNPTLRVETSYTALEEAREEMKRQEWVDRLIDTP